MTRLLENLRGRRPAARRLRVLALVGLVLAPVLIATTFTTAQRESVEHLDRIHAAVVNHDEPVEVDGEIVPLGRVLVAELTKPGVEPNITWTLTDADTASDGLARGGFAAVLTVPGIFSAAATSLASDDPTQAMQATLDLQTWPAGGGGGPPPGRPGAAPPPPRAAAPPAPRATAARAASRAAGQAHSSRSRTCWRAAVASVTRATRRAPRCRSRAHAGSARSGR
jgi:YhgE/Pip-like protein